MLNLAFSTLPCDGWDVVKIIEYCKNYGFNGVELRESNDSSINLNLNIESRRRISDWFQNAGITVTDLGSSITIKGLNREQETFGYTKGLIDLASHLNARGVRIFAGNFIRKFDDPVVQLDYKKVIQTIKMICDYAQSLNLEIWVETHNEFGAGKTMIELINEVNRANCKVIWDIIHPIEDGEEPEDTYKYLGKYCAHVHVKDAVPFEDPMEHDWKYTGLGDGVLPINKIVEILHNNQYDGFFSLEWESKWRKELQFEGSQPEAILPYYSQFMRDIERKIGFDK